MVKFGERERQIETAFKGDADYIGCKAAAVQRGNWKEEVQVKPPGVVIYMLPNDLIGGSTPAHMATVLVFAIVGPHKLAADTKNAAVEMAWRCYQSLRKRITDAQIRFPSQPVEADVVNADYAAATLTFSISYDIEPKPADA